MFEVNDFPDIVKNLPFFPNEAEAKPSNTCRAARYKPSETRNELIVCFFIE